MKETAFEKTNWGWQWSQWMRNMSETLELQLKHFFEGLRLPNWNLPDEPVFSSIGQAIQNILTLLLVIGVIWLLWRIVRHFNPHWLRRQRRSPARSVDRPLSSQQWVLRSQTYQRQGDYYQACRCLYMAMLQQLNDRQIIPNQASRTDQEYQLLIWQLSDPDPFESLLRIHQLLCFSDRPATPQLFNDCQQAYQAILRTNELAPKRDRL